MLKGKLVTLLLYFVTNSKAIWPYKIFAFHSQAQWNLDNQPWMLSAFGCFQLPTTCWNHEIQTSAEAILASLQHFCCNSFCQAMAVPPAIVQAVNGILDSNQPINQKLQKVIEKLEANNLVQRQILLPSQILCHPQNRGGTMLSFHDVWAKGAALTNVGIQRALLEDAICIQMAKDPVKRSNQVAKNQQLTDEAKGFLPPLAGTESFLANKHVLFPHSL